MLEVIVGLAILLFAVLFPKVTAIIILGCAVVLTVPDARKRLRELRRR